MVRENKNYDIFKGISQKDRFKDELHPDFVKIDDRKLSDLLQFVRNYAKEINFFDTHKSEHVREEQSDWSIFFNRDNLILLIAVTNFKLDEYEKIAYRLMEKVFSTHDQELKRVKCLQLFDSILLIADNMNNLRKHLTRDESTSDLIFDIGNAIRSKLSRELKVLYTFKQTVNWDTDFEETFKSIQRDWGFVIEEEPTEIFDIDFVQNDQIKSIFDAFFNTAHYVMNKSEQLLQRLLTDLKNNKPHISLYIAFLKLFNYIQKIQNEIPKKHLDFYYRDVLRQHEHKPKPDSVYVTVKLAPDQKKFRLPKGTILSAGKTNENIEIEYATTRSVHLSDVKIAKICSTFKSTDRRCTQKPHENFITSYYAYEKARPEKGGFVFNSRRLFGEEQFDKIEENKTMQEARVGFLVASPELKLSKGKRRVSIILDFDPQGFDQVCETLEEVSKQNDASFDETVYQVFTNAFLISYSTEDRIVKLDGYEFKIDFEEKTWNINFELDHHQPGLVPFLGEQEKFPQSEHPFVQILLRYECSLFLYSIVHVLNLENIYISTQVKQVTELNLYNNLGAINPKHPFELFGPIPLRNSYLILGHPELFTKNITDLTINLRWYSLPILQGGMEKYYAAYMNKDLKEGTKEQINSAHYLLSPSYLIDGVWTKSTDENVMVRIFQNVKEKDRLIADQYQERIEFNVNLESLGFQPEVTPNFEPYSSQSTSGFLRFDLACPHFAFGHNHYAPLLSEVVLKNATRKKKDPHYESPQLPFSPVVDKIEVTYQSEIRAITETASLGNKTPIDFYHLNAFGYEKIELKSLNQYIPLVRTDENEGAVYFGLDQYPLTGELCLLFEMDDEVLTKRVRHSAEIKWWYLKNNSWFAFDQNDLLNDSTNGFINSGIIQLRIPPGIATGNTVLDESLLWIKGTIMEGALMLGKVTRLFENGVPAIHVQNEALDRISETLPAERISRSLEKIPEILEIQQPMQSFGGKAMESVTNFYQRVSERLRHKNRAINAIDYEQLVLEQFPSIYKVKCFMANHSLSVKAMRDPTKVLPGSVIVAVTPDTSLIENKFSPRATTQTLNEIKAYLENFTSPFVHVNVINPFYEEVRVFCKVQFSRDESESFYEQLLQKDIIGYLNPWLFDFDIEEEFGKSIFKSDVMAHIQKLAYVEFVTEFSMIKIVEKNEHHSIFDTARNTSKGEEIKTIYPWSVLVSTPKHDINVIRDPSYQTPKPRGIGNMGVETDFILSN